MPIADSVADLTPAWFTAALREGGTITGEHAVTSVKAEPFGTGQVGLVVRAELEHDGPNGLVPPSLVVKLPSPDAGSRGMATAMGLYEAEVRFYEEIAPRLGPAIPTMHWGGVEGASGRFTLVLDDLSGAAEVGDMVAGCDHEQAALAIDALADFQVPVWADPGSTGASLARPRAHRHHVCRGGAGRRAVPPALRRPPRAGPPRTRPHARAALRRVSRTGLGAALRRREQRLPARQHALRPRRRTPPRSPSSTGRARGWGRRCSTPPSSSPAA